MYRSTFFVIAALLSACSTSSGGGGSPPDGDASPAADASSPSFAPIDVALGNAAPFWHADVTIGGQRFALSVDTGSATTVVASSSCTSCGKAHLYTPGPDAVDESKPVSGVYDTGEITFQGEIFEDAIAVGAAPPVRARIGAIASQKNLLDEMGGADGILGMGPTLLAAPGTTSVMDAVVASGVPDVFSFALCPGAAHMWLGGFDATQATAPIQWTPLLPATKELPFYNVKVAGMAIDHQPLDVPASSWGTAMVDTGNPAFDVPQAVLDGVVAAISANGEFAKRFGDAKAFYARGACVASSVTLADVDAALPPLSLVFGDDASVSVDLPASQSYLVPSSELGSLAGVDGWCPGITAGGSGPPAFDLGNSFLRSLLVVFDRAQSRFGVAPRPECTTTP